jgi:hypothetical protein
MKRNFLGGKRKKQCYQQLDYQRGLFLVLLFTACRGRSSRGSGGQEKTGEVNKVWISVAEADSRSDPFLPVAI